MNLLILWVNIYQINYVHMFYSCAEIRTFFKIVPYTNPVESNKNEIFPDNKPKSRVNMFYGSYIYDTMRWAFSTQ